MEQIIDILDGSNHIDNSTNCTHYGHTKELLPRYNYNPQEYLLAKLEHIGIKNRTKPIGTWTTETVNTVIKLQIHFHI